MNKTQKILSFALLTVSAHAFTAGQLQVVRPQDRYDFTRFNFVDCKTGKDCSAYVAAEVVKQDKEKFTQARESAFTNANNRSFVVRPFAKGYLYTGIGLSGLYHGLGVTASYGWNILKYPLTALGIVTAANYFFEDKIAQVVDSPEKLMAGAVAAGGLVGLVCGPRDVAKNNRLVAAERYNQATGEYLFELNAKKETLAALDAQSSNASTELNRLNGEVLQAGQRLDRLVGVETKQNEKIDEMVSTLSANSFLQLLQLSQGSKTQLLSLQGLAVSVCNMPDGPDKIRAFNMFQRTLQALNATNQRIKQSISTVMTQLPEDVRKRVEGDISVEQESYDALMHNVTFAVNMSIRGSLPLAPQQLVLGSPSIVAATEASNDRSAGDGADTSIIASLADASGQIEELKTEELD